MFLSHGAARRTLHTSTRTSPGDIVRVEAARVPRTASPATHNLRTDDPA
ncbi:hypothetical protein [Acidihalobacter aeolianus]|nr:hypothetical protein [Acidihalobacter aeolianus]